MMVVEYGVLVTAIVHLQLATGSPCKLKVKLLDLCVYAALGCHCR